MTQCYYLRYKNNYSFRMTLEASILNVDKRCVLNEQFSNFAHVYSKNTEAIDFFSSPNNIFKGKTF